MGPLGEIEKNANIFLKELKLRYFYAGRSEFRKIVGKKSTFAFSDLPVFGFSETEFWRALLGVLAPFFDVHYGFV